MSHVIVGERLAGMNPEMVGHVVKGAGHFFEAAGGLFQNGAPHMPAIPVIAARNVHNFSPTTAAAFERWQWEQLQLKNGNGSLMANSERESTAAENFVRDFIIDPIKDHYQSAAGQKELEVLGDAAIAAGSALAGDMQSAVEYGAKATENFVDLTLRNMGLRGGWPQNVILPQPAPTPPAGGGFQAPEGWGPTPGYGTVDPPGSGR